MITILVFVPGDFEEVLFKKLTSTVVLIPLAQGDRVQFKVYVIDRPVDLVVDTLKGFKRLKKKLTKKNIINGKINIFAPLVLLNEVIHESLCSWNNFNMKMFIWQVKRLIKRESVNSDELILWSYSPFHWKVMKEIPARGKIYEVYDEYCYDSDKDRIRENVYNAEKKMIMFSNEIICASEKLKEKFLRLVPIRKKIHLISTSASAEMFEKSSLRKYLPWDIIPGPKAVILGAIRSQTDLEIVEKLSIKIPNS